MPGNYALNKHENINNPIIIVITDLKAMKKKKIFYQLSVMMFMQYFIYAVWWVPFAAYLKNTLTLTTLQVTLILCSVAIGSMASAFIGIIVDRRFASQKVLAVLNLLTALSLLIVTQQTSFIGLMISVTLVMLFYMPTQSLTSSIAMTHIPAEQFPRMRLLGTLGWIAAGGFSIVAINILKMDSFDLTIYPLYCGVGAGVVAVILNLFLPDTPPKGDRSQKISVKDVLGLKTLSLLKNKNYNVFIFISLLAIIPFTLYHLLGSMFFADVNVKYITVTMNWGQVAEMFFLFITTTILLKCGFKKTLLFGLIAMLIRYTSFYFGVELGQTWLYYIGILTHGLIFGLFFVGGQVYTDKVAPKEIRAQAQGFLFFLVWGIGYLAGTLFNGFILENFKTEGAHNWSLMFGISSVFTLVIIILFVILFKPVKMQEEPVKQEMNNL